MFMRYRGGGVGHLTSRAATDFFKGDRHPQDQNRNQQDKMDVDDVDRRPGDNNEDERLGSADDPGSDMDEKEREPGFRRERQRR
jgi:hypothetical protein